MNRVCLICEKTFASEWRGWYDNLIPRVCSGPCFCELLYSFDEIINPRTFTKITPGWYQFRESSGRVAMRSSYELRLAKFLDDRAIPFLYEQFKYRCGDGTGYAPDFLLRNAVWVEVKGLWRGPAKQNVLKFLRHQPDMPFFLIDLKALSLITRRRP